MQVKTNAIVISAVKYQEKSLIVKCFTQSHGLISYFIKTAYSSKKSNQKIAYFQPLNLLEIEANHKNKGNLEYFTDVKLAYNYHNIPFNIVKSSIVFFLSEVLHHAIKEEEKNENLFIFIETSLIWLDTQELAPNFHLIFILELTKYLGFYPQLENTNNNFFEMNEGVFLSIQNISCINQQESTLVKKLINLKFDSINNTFSVSERQALLKILLDYFAIHLHGFKTPKSLDVLKELFS